MDDRTTGDLIVTLGKDIERCQSELLAALEIAKGDQGGTETTDDEYHARQLIRAIFSFIEAVTFSVKIWSITQCMDNHIFVSDGERYLAADTEHTVTSDGKVVERPAHIRLADNIRLAFSLLERAMGEPKLFDPGCEWWSCLKSSIKVRDRLTHPKMAYDVDVSYTEITTAMKAYLGFKNTLGLYTILRKQG